MVLGNAIPGHGNNVLTQLAPPQISAPGTNLKAPHKSVFNIIMAAPDQSFVLFLHDN